MKQLEIGRLPELDYAATEALNTLATNISFCGEDIRCILLTSRFASEGKSTTAMHLARTIAGLGKSVVLVDGDLRRSKLMSTYQITFQGGGTHNMGLAHYLAGQCEIDDVLYATNIEGAYMVPVGREVSSSLQLLTSARLGALFSHLRKIADVIIVDSSPVGVIVDGLQLAKYCDGAVVVVGYNQGHMRELVDLKENIEMTGCRVLGSVLSQVPATSYKNHKYYYRYGYRKYYSSYYRYYEKEEDAK